jgi:hypothetical protein
MNHLEKLKQQLMVKPNIKEREHIAVVIQGEKINNKKINKPDSLQDEIMEFGKELSKIESLEGILPIELPNSLEEEKEKEKESNIKKPIIIDKTKDGYNRNALLQKLAENNLTKVTFHKKAPVEFTISLQKKEKEKGKKEKGKTPLFIIEEDDEEKEIPVEKDEIVIQVKPKEKKEKKEKTKRITQKVEKGVAILGPEIAVTIGDTNIIERLPKKQSPIHIKVGSYIMNNREIFVNFINSLFEPYKRELEENTEGISCDTIGKTTTDFSLLTHQKIVRDYMNLYTPYRGLLLYHGLGSGKTCTSIALAEGMKDSKNIIVMTPASLRANYIGELKKCGDLLYKKMQYWEWISVEDSPELLKTISAILNLPQEYIHKQKGAFFINMKKKPNYDELTDTNKRKLDEQLNEMIEQKYQFINYNGLRAKKLEQLTNKYTKNIFDNSVVIIDEAHNFISRIVNKLKKEKTIPENKRGEKERLPIHLSTKLYEMLLSANNARIILLSGTPIINYPNEFGILFNILRGYIKTWKIPLVVNTNKKIDKQILHELLLGEKTLDYIDYSPSSKILTITRNPFGFKNKIKKESGYQGVSNNKKNEKGETILDTEIITDDEFERKIISILKKNDIDIVSHEITIQYKKALPDKFDEFIARYVDETGQKLKNSDALKRRILGLSSYFRSAQENLLPRFNKQLGVDYHVIRVPMSDVQFKIYESARVEERKLEKKQTKQDMMDNYEEKASTYRIFSRLFCNYIIPDRPVPLKKKKSDEKEKEGEDKEKNNVNSNMVEILKEANKIELKHDMEDDHEGEVEGDEVLQDIGGTTYMERLQNKMKELEENAEEYFTPEALKIYSPKFLHILENIQDEEYSGLHLVYSQFRTAEGIGLFTLVLNKNGFARFKINKNNIGLWKIDIPLEDEGKPTYALYTGTESVEEKEILRKIYNGEWDEIPDSISEELKSKYKNNNMGEVIKVFMITSSGSEGINLRNTRYVHLMDPYWHPVRSEQVIGRARRICSHKDLPPALQTVEVFVYLMVFTEAQLKSDEAIELKRKDLSKSMPKIPLTSDQYLFEISEIKANLTNQLTDAIKQSAFDCFIYSNGKCVNFGNPTIDKFTYVPDYTEQENDATSKINKVAIEWKGKPITINGVEYVYRKISNTILNIYDKKSYENALTDPTIVPVQIGTLETNERGEKVFKQIVNK